VIKLFIKAGETATLRTSTNELFAVNKMRRNGSSSNTCTNEEICDGMEEHKHFI
jgi:hypothetical protein